MVGCTFRESSPNYLYGGKLPLSFQIIHPIAIYFYKNPHFYHWAKSGVVEYNELRIPFGSGCIPAIAAYDVARVAVVVLTNPTPHIGKSYDLTGPKVVDMNELANAFSAALGRNIRYVPLDWDEWKATTLKEHVTKDGWEQHTADHLANLAKLVQNSTVQVSPNVELLTGSPGMDFEQWAKQHAKEFTKSD
jgi:nucleoside-diphosphate-sugar epimerase